MTLEEIYREYHNKVLYYIRDKVKSSEDAEDLCSEVFLKVNKNLAGYDSSKAAVSTWVYMIARNTIIDFYRTNREYDEIPEELSSDSETDYRILRAETLSELAEALKELSDEERTVIVLHYYKGLSLTEIERVTDMSYGQVKLRHGSGLKAMRQFLQKHSARDGFYIV